MPPKPVTETITPLEAALLGQVQAQSHQLAEEMKMLRSDLRFFARAQLVTSMGLLLALLFLAGVLALGKGIDPRPASEAVQGLAPTLMGSASGLDASVPVSVSTPAPGTRYDTPAPTPTPQPASAGTTGTP